MKNDDNQIPLPRFSPPSFPRAVPGLGAVASLGGGCRAPPAPVGVNRGSFPLPGDAAALPAPRCFATPRSGALSTRSPAVPRASPRRSALRDPPPTSAPPLGHAPLGGSAPGAPPPARARGGRALFVCP